MERNYIHFLQFFLFLFSYGIQDFIILLLFPFTNKIPKGDSPSSLQMKIKPLHLQKHCFSTVATCVLLSPLLATQCSYLPGFSVNIFTLSKDFLSEGDFHTIPSCLFWTVFPEPSNCLQRLAVRTCETALLKTDATFLLTPEVCIVLCLLVLLNVRDVYG